MIRDLQPQKILFLSVMNGAAWGGSEELWYQSALKCAEGTFEVSVCCYDWNSKQRKLSILKDAGITIYTLPGKEYTKGNLIASRWKISRIIRDLPFENFDLVIVNQGGWKDLASSPFDKLFLRLSKYIILFHNYNQAENISNKKLTALQKWVDKSHLNLGASEVIFEVMDQCYNIQTPRTGTLINPLTIPITRVPYPFPALTAGNYIFSVLAALDVERKAQDILIKVFAADTWKDRNWQLHLWGEGKDKRLLKSLVQKYQLENKIFIHGNAPDYFKALNDSHMVLQITHLDAMPITVLEAMACGRPVIVSKVGDMPKWVQHDQNGWVCEKVREEDIAEVLEKAWENRGSWESLGTKAFEIFSANYPADPIAYFLKQAGIKDYS